jgi:hypothetical protein
LSTYTDLHGNKVASGGDAHIAADQTTLHME